MHMAQPRKIATLKKLAAERGIPYETLRQAGLNGKFPLVRFDRALRAHPEDIDRFIEQHTGVAV
jgi:hypothetical protein